MSLGSVYHYNKRLPLDISEHLGEEQAEHERKLLSVLSSLEERPFEFFRVGLFRQMLESYGQLRFNMSVSKIVLLINRVFGLVRIEGIPHALKAGLVESMTFLLSFSGRLNEEDVRLAPVEVWSYMKELFGSTLCEEYEGAEETVRLGRSLMQLLRLLVALRR